MLSITRARCGFYSGLGTLLHKQTVWGFFCSGTAPFTHMILLSSPTHPCVCINYCQWQQCCFQMNLFPEWINKPGSISGRDTKEVNDRVGLAHPHCSLFPWYLEANREIVHLNLWPQESVKTIGVVSETEPHVSLPSLGLLMFPPLQSKLVTNCYMGTTCFIICAKWSFSYSPLLHSIASCRQDFLINRALAKDWTWKMTHHHRLEDQEVIERHWGNVNLLTLLSFQGLDSSWPHQICWADTSWASHLCLPSCLPHKLGQRSPILAPVLSVSQPPPGKCHNWILPVERCYSGAGL